jgi:hypothetical protein
MTYDEPLLVITTETEVPQVAPQECLQTQDTVKLPCSADTESNTKQDDSLHPYTTVMVWRKPSTAIRINNKLVSRYLAPSITEYLDLSTGEIIQASDLRNDPRIPPQIHVGEIILLRQALLDSLRKEVKEFALFVLHFRNNRRGITPEIETLVEWYARLHGKRPSNVRRYVTVLEKAGFLAGSSLLSRLFQNTGKRAMARDHLGEDVVARRIYFSLCLKAGLGAAHGS